MNEKKLNIEEFWKKGFIKTSCAELGIDLDRLFDKALDFIEKRSNVNPKDRSINLVNGVVGSFHELHKSTDVIDEYIKSNVLDRVAQLFDGRLCEIRAAEYFAKPALIGLESPWHQDNYYWCLKKGDAITIWMAIDRASSLNGGVTYLEGSHKLGTKKHIDSFAPGSSQMIDAKDMNEYLHMFNVVTPVLLPGECLIHHSNIIHGSSKNTSNFSRRGLTLQVKTVDDEYDELKKANYEAGLEAQILERSRIK